MIFNLDDAVGVDFEATYKKKVRDISTLGAVPYLQHPDTDIYMASVVSKEWEFAGYPADAPWQHINGRHWVSHNAGFDEEVFNELRRISEGALDGIGPIEWDCSANLCAFLGLPRDLAGAYEQLYGEIVSKETRDKMNGKTWEGISAEMKEEVRGYALSDSQKCRRIWVDNAHKWPAQEVSLSRHTMMMCHRGLQIDLERVNRDISVVANAIFHCEADIPWVGEPDPTQKPAKPGKDPKPPKLLKAGNKAALARACAEVGIPAPLSTADKSPVYDKWLEDYGRHAPFVAALKEHRRLERIHKVLLKLRDQTRPNGRLHYSLKYFGAHTGRWSGSGGLNFHNLNKEALCFGSDGRVMPRETMPGQYGVAHVIDLRGCIIPAPGKKFIVADLRQIEARVTLWYAMLLELETEPNKPSAAQYQLELLRQGMDVYEAHARASMGYTDPRKLSDYVKAPDCPESHRKLRHIAKARVLGLGFGMGWRRLKDYALKELGLELTSAEAKDIVEAFRKANPGVVAMWKKLQSGMAMTIWRNEKNNTFDPFTVELPSWRSLEYFDCNGSGEEGGMRAREERGGTMLHWFGGKLFENLVQATARDVLGEAILRLESAGFHVVLHVHDEVLCEVDMHVTKEQVYELMIPTPDWAPGLPIDSSVDEAMCYFKD